METGFLHLHKTAVILFMALYLFKWIGLTFNQQGLTAFFAKKGLRIFEMVISTLFLFTGIYLLMKMPAELRSNLLWIKIALVLSSIPIAVIGFKRSNKILATLSVLMIVAASGLAEMHKKRPAVNKEETVAAISGEEIYKANNCAVCHGADGKLMLNSAKDLTASTLSRAETEHQILNGKNAMPGYKNSLTPEQLKSLTDYVEGFRNK
ncbi:MAG: c-type cytochrome [Sphingomonadales bacterium]